MLKKGLEAVQLIALHGELSARELGEAMGLPKSTAHRLMAALVEVRLIEPVRGGDGSTYAVGPLVGELSGSAFAWRALVKQARPELEAVREDTGETVGIHMLYGQRRVLLDQVVSHHELRWVYANHMVPMPLRAGATGKMFLAMLEPAELAEVLKREGAGAKAARATAVRLQGQIDDVKKRGYSTSTDELNPGISSVAVPVPAGGSSMLPRVVISLATPSVRVTPGSFDRQVTRLLAAAARIRDAVEG